jgi:ATP-dependent DNA helicase RecG
LTLDTSIEFLKGIGTERAKLIANVLDIRTVEDFLHFFPIRYLDKSKVYKIADIKEDNLEIQLKGRITELQEITYAKGKKRLSGKFTDGTGTLDVVWFQYSNWMKEQIPVNREIYIFGRVQEFNHSFSMPHPEIELEDKKSAEERLRPIYPSSEKLTKRGLNQKFFQTVQANIISQIPQLIEENLPVSLMKSLRLMSRQQASSNFNLLSACLAKSAFCGK